MGLNTIVVIRNDNLHAIESDPSFGRNLGMAINAGSSSRHRLAPMLHDAKVVGVSHVSSTELVAVGMATVRATSSCFVAPLLRWVTRWPGSREGSRERR